MCVCMRAQACESEGMLGEGVGAGGVWRLEGRAASLHAPPHTPYSYVLSVVEQPHERDDGRARASSALPPSGRPRVPRTLVGRCHHLGEAGRKGCRAGLAIGVAGSAACHPLASAFRSRSLLTLARAFGGGECREALSNRRVYPHRPVEIGLWSKVGAA